MSYEIVWKIQNNKFSNTYRMFYKLLLNNGAFLTEFKQIINTT